MRHHRIAVVCSTTSISTSAAVYAPALLIQVPERAVRFLRQLFRAFWQPAVRIFQQPLRQVWQLAAALPWQQLPGLRRWLVLHAGRWSAMWNAQLPRNARLRVLRYISNQRARHRAHRSQNDGSRHRPQSRTSRTFLSFCFERNNRPCDQYGNKQLPHRASPSCIARNTESRNCGGTKVPGLSRAAVIPL